MDLGHARLILFKQLYIAWSTFRKPNIIRYISPVAACVCFSLPLMTGGLADSCIYI
jgi:hypothetical protein